MKCNQKEMRWILVVLQSNSIILKKRFRISFHLIVQLDQPFPLYAYFPNQLEDLKLLPLQMEVRLVD